MEQGVLTSFPRSIIPNIANTFEKQHSINMSGRSKVGYPSSYEGGDQVHFSREAVHEEGRLHGVNTDGYRMFMKDLPRSIGVSDW